MFKERRVHEKKLKIVVGWMGSTAHRSGDLEIIRPYSNKISEFASWHHTGDINMPNVPKFHKEIKVSAGCVSYMPFLPPYELNKGFVFDVGIVPLTDIPFNHAKSYIKGLEYAAAGVPFVCSYSPQYDELTSKHNIGVMVKSPADYVDALRKFTDVDYRKSQADKNYKNVKKFDSAIGARSLIKSIRSLAGGAK